MDSNSNKQLLWKLLYNKHLFTNFENNQYNEIKQLFDDLIIQVDNSSNDILLNKNKQFIQLFIDKLNKFEQPYKREDLINNRKKELLNDFNKKTDELNEFKPTCPPDIDFSDLIKETPIHLLNDTAKLTQKRKTDIPILQQILTILKEISDNQQEILNTLNESITLKTTSVNNTTIQPETDLINMHINE